MKLILVVKNLRLDLKLVGKNGDFIMWNMVE
ncbi:hypothetical protein J2Z69_002290 [Paenibacillus shirakamiensis]|uniref:Uncharacterized protein n=1 Tax=Paenibacillus shirakamiensis TaxID=1265935 RepID=A0ABS4JHS6_9BACL|nr:hypothetical protein [Paenibacillus shirakamiensis]